MGNKCATADAEIARWAAQQHGVVTARQLAAAGLGRTAISKRVQRGRLHRLHRGVYAVGHRAPSNERRWIAAVLACGDGAVLSHGSAAALWGLLRPFQGPVDVAVPTAGGRRQRAGIHIHRCPSLASDRVAHLSSPGEQMRHSAVTVRRGIPVTSPWRTVWDLRGAVSWRLYRRAARQAELHGYALAPRDCGAGTRSDLEDDFLAFVRRHRLPPPEVNVQLGRWEVDFLWRAERLAVETDFHDYHRGSVAFEDDHRRDMGLRRMGYAVRRYTGAQLRDCPAEIAAELREVLARGSETGRSRARAS